MNLENLHTLIDRYEENYYMINGSDYYEKFKWGAVRGFRDVWFFEDATSLPFLKLFDTAMKRSSIRINNSMILPTMGIVKIAEQKPEDSRFAFRTI